MSDPVPAVREAEASGEVAALFADIRAVYAVSNVNLIWRHLATLPQGLALVWGVVRPLYVSGIVAREADALKAAVRLPALGAAPSVPPAVRDVLDNYDRTNRMALVALAAASAALAGEGRNAPALGSVWRAMPAPGLPALLDLAAMDAATAARVMRINRIGATEPEPVLASMYRHLAHWPAYLAWAETALAGADGLASAIAACGAAVRGQAAAIAPAMPAIARPDIQRAIARFTGEVLPRMAVICAMLRAA